MQFFFFLLMVNQALYIILQTLAFTVSNKSCLQTVTSYQNAFVLTSQLVTGYASNRPAGQPASLSNLTNEPHGNTL